jgi:azurin
MTPRVTSLIVGATISGAALVLPCGAAGQAASPQDDTPKILFTQSPRAVEYQLNRLTNDQLARVERTETDVKYRPVYYALLTRKGIGREYFDEALGALAKMDKFGQTGVLLEGLSRVKPDDEETAARLLRVLFALPADALRGQRRLITQAAETPAQPLVQRGAYGAMMLADGDPAAAWAAAAKQEGHLVELLRGVPYLPSTGPGAALRGGLFEPVAAALARTQDPAERIALLTAIGFTRPDAATFTLLAREVTQGTDAASRAAAIRSLHQIPKAAWPAGPIEPLVKAIVAQAQNTPAERRTEPAVIEATQLAEKLSEGLSDESRRAARRDLRSLGVQVVRIEAVPEEMSFDVKWFVVEAGKPVQIVLYNPDAMSHNLVVGKPGALRDIGMAASTMTLSADPKVKPYVPDSPLVLEATRLLNWGETDRLSFTAPAAAGDYPYVCTFPGHWVRMYGVMLVVENLDAWEASRKPPNDPMTGAPYPAQRK